MKKLRTLLETTSILKPQIKKKMNNEIQKLLKPIYFVHIPLSDIFDILNKYNVVALQEDDTEWSGFLLGGVSKTEQVYFNLAFMDSKNENGMYTNKIRNSMLALSYYKMGSGKYEVLSYIT